MCAILAAMAKQIESDRFVRLKLTGEIVEVVGIDSGDVMINFRGQTLFMAPHQVSCISPEEAATLGEKPSSFLDLR